MPVEQLAKEIAYFEAHRDELVKISQGKFALIKGEECFGTFDTAENAYEEGARQFGNEPFLIQEVLPEDPIQDMPAFCLGLLHAHF
jgi:hypothetical protein